MNCFEYDHYVYLFASIVMAFCFYPSYLISYPCTQFKNHDLDLKFNPQFLLWINFGTLANS